MGRNPRAQDYDEDGNPKPGGKLQPDPLFLAVPVRICPKCKRVLNEANCGCIGESMGRKRIKV